MATYDGGSAASTPVAALDGGNASASHTGAADGGDAFGLSGSAGTLAGTLPAPSASLAADVRTNPTGTLAGSLPAPVAALDGAFTVTGSLAGSLPSPVADLAGSVGGFVTGALAGSLPSPVADLAGTFTAPAVTADLAGVLAGPVADFAGTVGLPSDFIGTLAGTLPMPEARFTTDAMPAFAPLPRESMVRTVAASLPEPVLIDGRPA